MRIALVDPSRTTCLIVTRLLEARGHQVVPFADEREALKQIKIDQRIGRKKPADKYPKHEAPRPDVGPTYNQKRQIRKLLAGGFPASFGARAHHDRVLAGPILCQ